MPVQGRERDDRRRGERHPINPEFGAQGQALTYVGNLSEYGVFIHTRVRLPVGAAVDLHFTVMLDDPVVIHGPGRVVHHQDEPRGMGVAFNNLPAFMQLRVIDAINWYRARANAGDQGLRTRELSPEELAQIDEEGDETDESATSLSSSDMVSESGAFASMMNASIEELGAEDINTANSAAASASAALRRGPLASRSQAPGGPAGPVRPAPPLMPVKDDEYEDF